VPSRCRSSAAGPSSNALSRQRQYGTIFRRFCDALRDELGRPPVVGDLTADVIAAYARHLEASGGRAALSTRRVQVTMLRALADELGLDDVADAIRFPRTGSARRRP
jgi:hypothetical protein